MMWYNTLAPAQGEENDTMVYSFWQWQYERYFELQYTKRQSAGKIQSVQKSETVHQF